MTITSSHCCRTICVSTAQSFGSLPPLNIHTSDVKVKVKAMQCDCLWNLRGFTRRWKPLHDEASRCCLTFIPASHNIASNRQMCKDQLTMFSFRGAERKRRTRKCEVKNGGFASRVVPNGVDATTAEWEGGAIRFIHAGLGICFCALREKKKMFYYHHLVMLFTPRCSAFCIQIWTRLQVLKQL